MRARDGGGMVAVPRSAVNARRGPLPRAWARARRRATPVEVARPERRRCLWGKMGTDDDRLSPSFLPIPYPRPLEQASVSSEEDVLGAAREAAGQRRNGPSAECRTRQWGPVCRTRVPPTNLLCGCSLASNTGKRVCPWHPDSADSLVIGSTMILSPRLTPAEAPLPAPSAKAPRPCSPTRSIAAQPP